MSILNLRFGYFLAIIKLYKLLAIKAFTLALACPSFLPTMRSLLGNPNIYVIVIDFLHFEN